MTALFTLDELCILCAALEDHLHHTQDSLIEANFDLTPAQRKENSTLIEDEEEYIEDVEILKRKVYKLYAGEGDAR